MLISSQLVQHGPDLESQVRPLRLGEQVSRSFASTLWQRLVVCAALAVPLVGGGLTAPDAVPHVVTANLSGQPNVAFDSTTVELVGRRLAPPSPAAVAALTNAMSKIGSPYRYGAAGPNAFDCSGLVNWSFARAGVSLPRTSRALASVGTPVSRRDLMPGDLVFFYQPISHVAIYIGDGKVVHASTRKSPVKISDLNVANFTLARRL